MMGSWLASGHLDLGRVPTIRKTDKGNSLCLSCAKSIVYVELLSFWEAGTWVSVSKGCLHDQPTIKILGTESLMSFQGWEHVTCVIIIHL